MLMLLLWVAMAVAVVVVDLPAEVTEGLVDIVWFGCGGSIGGIIA